jgi:anaerobic selenocysteine-containing dehydrogenase
VTDVYNPPLQVVKLIATKRGEEDRGPLIWMRGDDAAFRLVMDGELVWVHGPRRQELATVRIDDSLPRGAVVLRDVVGASPSEIIKIVKLDTDSPPRRGHYA